MAGNKTAGKENVDTTLSVTPGQPVLATVVAVPDDDTRIIQTLTNEKDSVFCVLNIRSHCETDEPLPDLQDDIMIKNMTRNTSNPFPGVDWYVEEYRIQERRDQTAWEEIVGVVEYDPSKGLISVVGRSFPTATQFQLLYSEKLHHKEFGILHDLVVATVRRMKKTFVAKQMFGCVAIVNETWEKVESSEGVCTLGSTPVPRSTCVLLNVRPLLASERLHISQDCRDLGDRITFEQAALYIRDFNIAWAKMDGHVARKSVKYHTIKVKGNSYLDTIAKTPRITVFLNKGQKRKCIDSTGQHAWRMGMELTMKHPDLLEKTDKFNGIREVAMTVDTIRTSGKMTEVTLKPSSRSESFFRLLRNLNHVFDTKQKFLIGPSSFESCTVFENLDTCFREFFDDKKRFDMWRGVTEPCKDEIWDLYEKFEINGTYFDRSQTIALRTAMARQGVTSVEAPPGSGKTYLTAALIGLKHEVRSLGAVYLSATTNAAIDNAVRVTNRCFDYIKISRRFSKAVEGSLDAQMQDLSICHQGLHYPKYVDPARNPQLGHALDKYERVSEKLAKATDLRTGLPLIQAKAGAQHEVVQRFYEAYRPEVFGTTCELLARKGTTLERKVAQEIKEGRLPKREDLQQCGTHLILDEASQIPPYLALAMHVMLYTVEKITVIGDSKQLGPYSGLEERSFARQLIKGGELGRVQRGFGTSKVNLSTIYRCHPGILKILYFPLYGPLSSGTTAEERNLAAVKGLPTAKDSENSPVLFVQTDGNCINAYNKEEIDIVVSFLETRLKDIPEKDILIVCHHRQQRSKLLEVLKGKEISIPVNTIDSSQGMEAKIVLVLMTKICEPHQNPHEVFRFVSDFNRETVAVSRAQHAVYLFGQWDQLFKTEFWRQFIPSVVKYRALVTSDWKEADQKMYEAIADLVDEE